MNQQHLTNEEQQLLQQLQTINHNSIWGHAIKMVVTQPTVVRFRGLVSQLKQQNQDNPGMMQQILQHAYKTFLLC